MGMDITYGTIWGVPLQELAEDLPPEARFRRVFDKYTGEPMQEGYRVPVSKILQNFGGFIVGQVVDDDKIEEFLELVRKKYTHYQDPDSDENAFYTSYTYCGFKSFAGEAPYIMPQDSCCEYKDTSTHARNLWDREFPGIPGRNLLFLYVSI